KVSGYFDIKRLTQLLTIPEMHLLRTKSGISSVRGASERRRYGASTVETQLWRGMNNTMIHSLC
ncbi:UNVERIFIED_CONTAM: hypothetical protein NY100_33775, partial [Prevotella sp. 15_C9]